MIDCTILPLTSDEVCALRKALYDDLKAHPAEYLNHADGEVRWCADWTMEFFKFRNLRPEIVKDSWEGARHLRRLCTTLQRLARPAREA